MARILARAEVQTAAERQVVRVRNERGVNLPVSLVMAIIERESYPRFNTESFRREPDGRTSYGLMQVLEGTARDLGLTGAPSRMYDPDTGIYYGTRYLAKQWTRYRGDVERVIAAYNAGTARKTAAGTWTNQAYVDFVLGKLSTWSALLEETVRKNPGPVALLLVGLVLVVLLARRGAS